MFCVSEAQAAVIRTAFEQRGELSAVVELQRLLPGLGNMALARACVRTIAGWSPLIGICFPLDHKPGDATHPAPT
jgi:hypothetical protein